MKFAVSIICPGNSRVRSKLGGSFCCCRRYCGKFMGSLASSDDSQYFINTRAYYAEKMLILSKKCSCMHYLAFPKIGDCNDSKGVDWNLNARL